LYVIKIYEIMARGLSGLGQWALRNWHTTLLFRLAQKDTHQKTYTFLSILEIRVHFRNEREMHSLLNCE
jgi:hypothetical protein